MRREFARWELLEHKQPRYVGPCSRREVSLAPALLSPTHVMRLHENTARLQLMLHSCPQSSLNLIGTASGIMLSYQAFGHTHSPRAGWSNLSNQLCTNTTYQAHTSAPEEKIRQGNLFGQKVCVSWDQMRRSSGSFLIREVCRRWRRRCPRAVFGWAHFFSPSHKDRSHPVHNPCQLSLRFFFLFFWRGCGVQSWTYQNSPSARRDKRLKQTWINIHLLTLRHSKGRKTDSDTPDLLGAVLAELCICRSGFFCFV